MIRKHYAASILDFTDEITRKTLPALGRCNLPRATSLRCRSANDQDDHNRRTGRRSGDQRLGATAHILRLRRKGCRPVLDRQRRDGHKLRQQRQGHSRETTSGNQTTIYDAGDRNVGRFTTVK
jgi:hypothetical protein